MTGKLLAAILLLFGGGVTLYIVYRMVLGVLPPAAQKKPGQKSRQNSKPPQNNLQLQNQPIDNKSSKTK